MRFDHLVHWVPQLETAVQEYRALGFTLEASGRHPGQGTRNAIWRIGPAYIELLAVDEDAPATGIVGDEWPALATLLDAGGGALLFAVLVDDVAATVRELRARAVDVSAPRPGAFQLSDGSSGGWTCATLEQGPVWAPFFINYGRQADEWIERGHRESASPWSLERIVIETPRPAAAAAWLAHVLDICPSDFDGEMVSLPLASCAVSLVPGPANQITTVVLTGTDAPSGEVAGLRYLRAATARRNPWSKN